LVLAVMDLRSLVQQDPVVAVADSMVAVAVTTRQAADLLVLQRLHAPLQQMCWA
jgi:hypothetical protein